MELETWGFHLLRSADDQQNHAIRLTDGPILARGRNGDGATYTWSDLTAQEGTAWYYWLQEIELDGTSHTYGPFSLSHLSAAGGDDTSKRRVFLPLVQR
jgi:hypothetical protein